MNQAGQQRKILIVDDEWESAIVRAVGRRLEQEGWQPVVVQPETRWSLGEEFEAAALYARLSGRDLSDFGFHRVLAMYKLGVVFVQLHAQYRRGTVTDPRYAPFARIGNGILEFAHAVAHGEAS